MNLKGKTSLITGGTKGIGFAVARALLRAGSRVFVCGRDKGRVREAVTELSEHGDIHGEDCDVRSESQVRQLVEECVRVFGGVDILVNNAGVGVFGKTVEETTAEEFRAVIETNLNGTFYTCHYAIPEIKKRGGGYIFNISSLAGQNAHPGMATYNASKFGLNGFSEALMQEVRHDGIKVSYLCPGSVNTEFGGDTVSQEKAWQLQPDDIARTVMDLLSFPDNALPSKVELRPSRPPR
ncbi:MAG: SDR family oxidoreductase [Acidobacteriota bacterium]|nr:SDR family oxidoreductase [Acidobacteriota bacterium]